MPSGLRRWVASTAAARSHPRSLAHRCASRYDGGARRGFISHAVSDRGSEWAPRPKVELHRHLEGAIRLSTVLEEAQRHGVALPHGPHAEPTPAPQLTLEGIRPHIQTLQPFPDLASLLSIFDRTQSTLCDMESFRRIAHEAVLDAHAEGIRALELRYAPSFASMGHEHDFDAVLDAILAGVEDAQCEVQEDKEGRGRMGVGLLCIGVGAMGMEEMGRTVDFLLRRRDAFVGFDMAGAEQDVEAFQPFFQRVTDAGIRATCHASEDLVDGVPENAMVAVGALRCERVGHGIQIHRSASAIEAVRASGAMLEVSVTSNWLTAAVPSVSQHPARSLWEAGVPLCVNTDDPGIMAIDLNHEWAVWTEELGFSVEEMEAMTLLALDRSFLPREERERVFQQCGFQSCRPAFTQVGPPPPPAAAAGAAGGGGGWASLADAVADARAVHARAVTAAVTG